MHTPRLIVAALGALAWLAPVTDAADDLQAQVEQLPQKIEFANWQEYRTQASGRRLGERQRWCALNWRDVGTAAASLGEPAALR